MATRTEAARAILIDALRKRGKALCEFLMEAHAKETIQAVLKTAQKTQTVRATALM